MVGATKLALILGFLLDIAFAIMVAEFQEDGAFSKQDYLRLKNPLDKDLVEFTACARVSIFFLRGEKNFFISYANNVTDDAFRAGLINTILEGGTAKFEVEVCKYKYISGECAEKELKGFSFNQWRHFCAVFKALNRTSGETATTTKLYIDGKLAGKPTNQILPQGKFTPLAKGGSFIVGQEQDDIGGFFDATQSLSGKVAQVEVWAKELTQFQIEKLAECEAVTYDIPERVVQWAESDWDIYGNASVEQVDLTSLCQPSPLLSKFVWPQKISYNIFKGYCDKLQGVLPIIPDNGITDETLKSVAQSASEQFYNLDEPRKNIESCLLGRNRSVFWLGQHRQEDGNWLNPYSKDTSFEQFAIAQSKGNCAYVFGDRVEPTTCYNKFPCGVCSTPPGNLLKIKGLCTEDVEAHYDTDYYVFGTKNGYPHFRGAKYSHIYYDSSIEKWRLQSLKEPDKYVWTAKFPLGTSVWEIVTENGLCSKKPNSTMELTMSLCYPNKYTCNSGDCIPLADKCDTDIDCADKSDEYYCAYLRFGENYAKELIPRDETGNALDVYLNVSILAFPSIDTVNLKFTADFFLNLRWYDLRIDFRDLNNVTSLNSLGVKDAQAIWSPRLGFTNALGPYQTTVDELTTGVLVRESDPLPEDVTLSTEAALFDGRDNAIFLTREYYQDYGCSFDLRYYPFDTQMCQMIFEMQGKTDNYVRFVKDGEGIEFLADKELVEYQIQMEKLYITSVNNISRAMARVVFRRRMEFHVTNTFLQTFILICVGYLSLFFDVDNFTDRIMVTLTTMLVVATIMSAISAGLPKTNYYKLIDWWLLFILNMLVLTMAFHTFVASRVAAAKNQPLTFMSENSLFLKKMAWPMDNQRRTRVMHSGHVHERSMYDKADFYGHNPPVYNAPNAADSSGKEADELKGPRRVNCCGKFLYVFLVLLFNAIFWYVSIMEYLRPAEEYIGQADDPTLV